MSLWCYRCRRTYHSYFAFDQHVRDSPKHHECPECDYDGLTWDDLLDHLSEEGCRAVCYGCDSGRGSHMPEYSYAQHVRDFNVCTDCHRHFASPGHLYQHRLSHRAHTYECYMCDDRFKTYSGMIIHLEYGACSHIDIRDLNNIAAHCYECDEFVEDGCIYELYYGSTVYGRPFKCPTCDGHFAKLSSLFQHIESSSCEQTLYDNGIDVLRRDLEYQLG